MQIYWGKWGIRIGLNGSGSKPKYGSGNYPALFDSVENPDHNLTHFTIEIIYFRFAFIKRYMAKDPDH